MKPKTAILMVVAVVCGLGASYMTSQLLAQREEVPAEAAPIEKVTLLVAKKNVEMHANLRKKPEDFFQEKQFVKEDAPKDALTPEDMPKLKDKFLKRGLRKGDHVLLDDLMDGKFGLVALPNGMRAIGIRVNVEQIAGGFASLPGSHVDIMWTTRRGGDNDTFSKVLLEDVIVLAADTNTHSEGGAMVASVVTVALHPDDAMKLNLAMETGSLRLIVRNLEDKSSSDRDRYSMAELIKDRSKKTKLDDGEAQPPEPPIRTTQEAPKLPEVPAEVKAEVKAPEPEVRVTKRTVTVRNGPEVLVRTYWVNDNDEIVPAPSHDQQNQPAVPAPAGNGKKDDN
jgi:Flp pilus assembly protein CpaB